MKKKIISFVTIALAVMLVAAIPLSASAEGYDAYIYTYEGGYKESAPVYEPVSQMLIEDSIGTVAKEPCDIYVDDDGLLYVCDAGSGDDKPGQILIYDSKNNYECINSIMSYYTYDENGSLISVDLESPYCCYKKNGTLYIADYKAGTVIAMNVENGFASLVISQPTGTGITEDFEFMPVSVCVDGVGQIYVISRGDASDDGIMVFDKEGMFQTFMGAQTVTLSSSEVFWRVFQTAEQRARGKKQIPAEYNNMSIDKDGFIYVTTSALDAQAQYSALISKSTSSDNAPIKRLNPSGEDVLRRAGFYPPAGDIALSAGSSSDIATRVSLFVDVDVNDLNTYVAIDSNNCRIFLYDYDGELLCAFGGKGTGTLGKFSSVTAVSFCGDDLIVLDKTKKTLTLFGLTDYGKGLFEALRLQEDREYSAALEKFESLLPLNANIDFVYVSMGKAYLKNGEYEKAMEYFRNVGDKTDYSSAYKYARAGTLDKIAIFIPIVLILVIWGLSKLLGKINKINKEDDLMKDPPAKLSHKLLYAFRCLTHPFDGFYELKRSKRGTPLAATIILVLASATYLFDAYFSGYLFVNGEKGDVNPFVCICSIVLPVLVWTVANWCVSSLLYGNGSFKDIYMVACYSLLPIVLIVIPTTIISNFLTSEEGEILAFVETIAYVWAILLIFLGTLTIHSYGLGKNIIATILSVVGMLVIVFLILLIFILTQKVYMFFQTLITEISYRI